MFIAQGHQIIVRSVRSDMTSVLTHCTPNIVGASLRGRPIIDSLANKLQKPSQAISMLLLRNKAGRPSMLRFQEAVVKTAKQFPSVKKVIVCVNGLNEFGIGLVLDEAVPCQRGK